MIHYKLPLDIFRLHIFALLVFMASISSSCSQNTIEGKDSADVMVKKEISSNMEVLTAANLKLHGMPVFMFVKDAVRNYLNQKQNLMQVVDGLVFINPLIKKP